jgi:hypothetical protein
MMVRSVRATAPRASPLHDEGLAPVLVNERRKIQAPR